MKRRPVIRRRRVPRRSLGELKLEALLIGAGLPAPVREYRAIPDRLFRFDLAYPDHNPPVLIELHGGTFNRGRHVTGEGFQRDREKHRLAALAGFLCLEYTTDELRRAPELIVHEVRTALRARPA